MTKLKNGAKGGVFIVPSNLAIFGDFWKFCFARNIGAFRKLIICALQWGIYCPLQLGIFLEIFGSFVLRVIFCALRVSNFGNLRRFLFRA
jgi:hypothetical protein